MCGGVCVTGTQKKTKKEGKQPKNRLLGRYLGQLEAGQRGHFRMVFRTVLKDFALVITRKNEGFARLREVRLRKAL